MAETELPLQVERFIQYGVSEAFSALLTQFYRENCLPGVWDTFDIQGEQTLERGACYQRYQQFVDEHLDYFCRAEGYNVAEVAELLQQTKSIEAGKEFLPSFLQSMEFEAFGRNMKEQSMAMLKQSEAFAATPLPSPSQIASTDFSALPIDLSGVWKSHTAYQNQVAPNSQLEEYLYALGCPWFARKILKYASHLINNVCIIQNGAGVSFTYKLLFFGGFSIQVPWNTDHEIPNLWNKTVTANLAVDPARNNITTVYTKEEAYFKGNGHCIVWTRINRPDAPGDMLVMSENIYGAPDGAGGIRDLTFPQFFIRDDSSPH